MQINTFSPGTLSLQYFTDDLSQNKVATQSQTEPDPKFYAHNAVDRDSLSCMRPKPIGLNNPDERVWWKVDLGRVYNIYSINILFKNYDGFGMY